MAGRKITRLREMLDAAEADLEKAKGTEDEPFAANRCMAIREQLASEEEHRARFGKRPGDPSVRLGPYEPHHARKAAKLAQKKTAARLVGNAALGHHKSVTGLDNAAGVLAAEIAVEGVRKDFVTAKPGTPPPLTDEEFANARDIVAAVSSGETDGVRLLSDGNMTRERWLAEAFPSLTEDRRVKCARFLSGMAVMAADKPDDKAPEGATVVEKALHAAGMTYVEFENARMTDVRFADSQAAIKAARKRCIMDRLEETLQNRALYGQDEETCDRFGNRNMVRRIDNRLAFDMLKYGHADYLKQNIEDKAKTTAMTLMIAQGAYPDAPKFKEPKQAEVIDV